jgi:hypothetical protein
MNDVRVGQAAGVEDRGLASPMVGDDADEAVADPAELITDRELGNTLGGHGVLVQPEASPPVLDSVVDLVAANANHSQQMLSHAADVCAQVSAPSAELRSYSAPGKVAVPVSLDVDPGPPGRISSAASPTASRLSGHTLSRVSSGVCQYAPGVPPGP